jgi:hypothetical protein
VTACRAFCIPGVFQRVARTATSIPPHPHFFWLQRNHRSQRAPSSRRSSADVHAHNILAACTTSPPVISGHEWLEAPATRPGAHPDSRVSTAMDRIIRCSRGRCALIPVRLVRLPLRTTVFPIAARQRRIPALYLHAARRTLPQELLAGRAKTVGFHKAALTTKEVSHDQDRNHLRQCVADRRA